MMVIPMLYSVDKAVFHRFGGFRRMVVVVDNVDNSAESPDLAALLHSLEVQARGPELEAFREIPALKAWIDMFSVMGLNPNRFPPSVVNLIKRVRNGKDLPYVNTLVAIFNCVSLKYLVPCGGDDRGVITGDLRLGLATGAETYIPLGQPDAKEAPPAGEVIYYDTGNLDVFCRACCWKNGDRSKMTSGTRSAIINVDSMDNLVDVEAAAAELADMVRCFTGGTAVIHRLAPDSPSFEC